jgi:hypothetical protein
MGLARIVVYGIDPSGGGTSYADAVHNPPCSRWPDDETESLGDEELLLRSIVLMATPGR